MSATNVTVLGHLDVFDDTAGRHLDLKSFVIMYKYTMPRNGSGKKTNE